MANTVLLMAVESDARAAIDAFRSAAKTKSWTQTFRTTKATYELSTLSFDRVADETLAFRIVSTVATTSGEIDYIVFRSGRVLSFLYVIEVDSAPVARKSAAKIEALVTGAL